MYTFYPITSLEDWFNQHGDLLKNPDLFSSPHLVLLYSHLIDQWLEKEIVQQIGISFGASRSDHVNNSVIYWAERLLSLWEENSPPIAQENHLFLALYHVNQKKAFLPPNSPHTLPYLKHLAKLFWLYDVDEVPFLEEWRSLKAPEGDLQRLFWQEIFLAPHRNFLSFSEALKKLRALPFSPADLPFSCLFYFSGYLSNPHILSFLHIFSQKGFDVHHIAFTPCLNWSSGNFPAFLSAWSPVYNETRLFLENHPAILLAKRTPRKSPLNLLQTIQNLLTDNTLGQPVRIYSQDRSFLLMEAPTASREIEILADEILKALQDPTVKAEDLSLLLGDTRLYLPLVEATFKERGIPFRLLGKDPRCENSPFFQGLQSLLKFPYSNFSIEDVLSFLCNESVLKKLKLAESDYFAFQRFIAEAGILYGMNGSHKHSLGTGKTDAHTWEKGFERLYLGLVSLNRKVLDSRPPLDFSFLEWQKLAPFFNVVQSLWEDSYWVNSLCVSLKEWSLFWRALTSRYLEREDPDFSALSQSLSRLENLGKSLLLDGKKLAEEALPFSLFVSLLEEDLKPAPISSGKEIQGVHVGSLEALAPLPARFAFLAGLGHQKLSSFKRDPLNLQHKRLKELREALPSLEREQFLRILMGSQEGLILSYSHSSLESSTENLYSASRPPFVNDLLTFLSQTSQEPWGWQWEREPLEQLIETHPTLASDPIYFRKEQKPFSSINLKAYEQAEILQEWIDIEEEESAPAYTLKAQEEPLNFNWYELRNFFNNPIRLFFERTEKIALPPLPDLSCQLSSLEDFDPSQKLWSADFWSTLEESGKLEAQSVEAWLASLDNLIAYRNEEDLLEEGLYTKKNIQNWKASLEWLHELLKPHFPLYREDWILWTGQEENSIGEWAGDNWILSGKPIYPTYRSGQDLFIIPPFEKKLYESDKAIIALQACLYKAHPMLKKKGLHFKTLHILKDSGQGWHTLFWHETGEDWFTFLDQWIEKAQDYPLPLYPEVLEALIKKGKEELKASDWLAIVEEELGKEAYSPSLYHHSYSPYHKILGFREDPLPPDFPEFLQELRNFWAAVTLQEKK